MRGTAASAATAIKPAAIPRPSLTAIIGNGRELPGGIVYTSVDGKSRRVEVPKATFDAEPQGEKYNAVISDCGEFVSYWEPLAESG